MDIATTLLEYGAQTNAESKAGFTPLHLSSQEGHTDMSTLLIEHQADVGCQSKNGLTPLHLCSQEDRVNCAAILVKNSAPINPPTKVIAGFCILAVTSIASLNAKWNPCGTLAEPLRNPCGTLAEPLRPSWDIESLTRRRLSHQLFSGCNNGSQEGNQCGLMLLHRLCFM